ncbi:MAG: LCP family protein [Promicromonosporaceae bacterium]|nr:LCP family protein [Promicromonosporaceae bacterium]
MSERRVPPPPSFTPSGARRPPASGATEVEGGSNAGVPASVPVGGVGGASGSLPRVRRTSSGQVPAAPPPAPGPSRRSVRQAPPRAVNSPGTTPASYQPASPGQAAPSLSPRTTARPTPVPAQGTLGSAQIPGTALYPAGRPPAVGHTASTQVPPSASYGDAPPATPPGLLDGSEPPRVKKRRRPLRIISLVLALLLAWPVGLAIYARMSLQTVDALSGAPATPGTTFLLAGSDARGEGGIDDDTEGARTDTILLLHQPTSGPTALISIPRDTLVDIPGRGQNRVNAAYFFGGPSLLVETVEGLTGMTIDHYIEIGFGGLDSVVNALGGIELCSDLDVHDVMSGMIWTPGCRPVNGTEALAFARMRYSDPLGDIGRTDRQRQMIGAITRDLLDPTLLVMPWRQVQLINSGTDAITVSSGTGALGLARLMLAFRAANGEGGVTGVPPISNMGHRVPGVGSTVLLNPNTAPQFWIDIRDGNLEPGVVGLH